MYFRAPFIFALLAGLFARPLKAGICYRTPQVRQAIISQIEVATGQALKCTQIDFELLSQVKTLSLKNSNLKALRRDDFLGLGSLVELDLSGNSLREFPGGLGFLPKLARLNLSRNLLAKHFPKSLSRLARLEWLDLSDNNLVGPLPEYLGKLTALEWLDISHNQLIGPLPSGMGDLKVLKFLNLSKNLLTGPIPATWSGMEGVEVLYLHTNRLTDPTPLKIPELKNLKRLDIYDNPLRPLPQSWSKNFDALFWRPSSFLEELWRRCKQRQEGRRRHAPGA